LAAAPVAGDPGLLDRVAGNLIDNAIVHNVEGGWLHVRTATENGNSILVVSNGGSTLAPEDLQRLFQPFAHGTRHAPSRTTGIGLSIVKSVIEAHAGSVSAEPLDGGGLRVAARLPAQPATDPRALDSSP
jgi:signal transduction histidine kinase